MAEVPCKKCFKSQHVWAKKDGEMKYTVRCKEYGVDLKMDGLVPVQLAECMEHRQAAESGQKGE